MTTWVGGPSPTNTPNGIGTGLFPNVGMVPSAQNAPATGQPGWIGAPAASGTGNDGTDVFTTG